MIVRKHITIHREDVFDFLAEHIGERVVINSTKPLEFIVELEQTEAEMHMEALHDLREAHRFSFTDEEIAALDYAIESIKTLDDMGILKGEQDND